MLAIPLYDQGAQMIGLMRVFSASRFTDEMESIYTKSAGAIGQFCARIHNLRNNFSNL